MRVARHAFCLGLGGIVNLMQWRRREEALGSEMISSLSVVVVAGSDCCVPTYHVIRRDYRHVISIRIIESGTFHVFGT